jgi:hypothetical protein
MSDKPKILIYAPREEPPGMIRRLEEAGYRLAFGDPAWQLPRGDHEAELAAAARDAVALLGTSIRHTPISRRVLEGAQRLRVVSKYTVGVDDVDIRAATDLGILVCHAPTEANCFGVAEMTVAMMLTMLKKIRERDADIRDGRWREFECQLSLRRQPRLRRLFRHHARHRRARPDRLTICRPPRAVEGPHPRPRPPRRADEVPAARGDAGRLSDAAAGIRCRLVSRRAE